MNPELELSKCQPVNHLWPDLLVLLGLNKANQLVRQAIDLQHMQGKAGTLPVVFINTGGIAFISFEVLKKQTGLSLEGDRKILLFSPKAKCYQILHEIKKQNE